MKINEFNNGHIEIETKQGTFFIHEEGHNIEVSVKNKAEEIVHVRLNRVNEVDDYKTGKKVETNDKCNPYVMVWLDDKVINCDKVVNKVKVQ